MSHLTFETKVDGSAVHALVVGISTYPQLSGSGLAAILKPVSPPTSAATSALLFTDWLKEAHLPLPLGSCRVLVAPSEKEREDPRFAEFGDTCTTDDFVQAASEWKSAARGDDGSMTIFFFAGEMVEVSMSEKLMLFQNFGSEIGPALRGAVSFANIYNGMTGNGSPIAQTQLYFLLGGQQAAARSQLGFALQGTTSVFDPWLDVDRRSTAVFSFKSEVFKLFIDMDMGSVPATKAIVDGLNGAAATSIGPISQESGRWGVTVGSLSQWLQMRTFKALTAFSFGVDRVTNGNMLIAYIEGPPTFEVSVTIEIDSVLDTSAFVIEDSTGNEIFRQSPALPQQDVALAPGIYAFVVQGAGHTGAAPVVTRELVAVYSAGLSVYFRLANAS